MPQGTHVTLRLELSFVDDTCHIMQPLTYSITIGTHPVVSHDVGVTRVIAPAGSLDSGTTVTPVCSVYNYGSSTESYTVRMKIGSNYSQTASVSSHASGTRIYVTFPDWLAAPVGTFSVKCSTQLSDDLVPSNDARTGTVTVLPPTGLAENSLGQTRCFALYDARPNPAADQTMIRFDAPTAVYTSVGVYDIRGRLIRTLAAAPLAPGRYESVWNRTDDAGRRVASGVYFCRMSAGGFRATSKLLLAE
jgi:hypothetical protein